MSKQGQNFNNENSFDALYSNIKRAGEKWKTSQDRANKANSFADMCKRMRDTRFFVDTERLELEKQLNDKRFTDTYSPVHISKQRERLEEQNNTFFGELTKNTRIEIRELIDSKRDRIYEMLGTPPSEQQNRLLQALGMRGNIDQIELQAIVPLFFGNYQALKTLETIAESNGITLTLPEQVDCRIMFDGLKKAEKYLLDACEDMTKPKERRNILFDSFYHYNPDEPNKIYSPDYESFISLFDHVPQLQEVATEKTHLTPTEKTKLDWFFKDIVPSDETAMLKRTNEVMETHPEYMPLLSLSDYAPYVTAVEQLKQSEQNGQND